MNWFYGRIEIFVRLLIVAKKIIAMQVDSKSNQKAENPFEATTEPYNHESNTIQKNIFSPLREDENQ